MTILLEAKARKQKSQSNHIGVVKKSNNILINILEKFIPIVYNNYR